jgi:hypothetical protein
VAEWSHDSYASLMADTYSLTTPDYPNLTFLQHHIRGTLRVSDNCTGLTVPWEQWPAAIRPLVPPPTFTPPADVVSINSTPPPNPLPTARPGGPGSSRDFIPIDQPPPPPSTRPHPLHRAHRLPKPGTTDATTPDPATAAPSSPTRPLPVPPDLT